MESYNNEIQIVFWKTWNLTITESDDKNMDADEVESENQNNRWKEGSKTNGYHSINGSDQCRFSEFLN
jgi:hypothetical protein